MLPLDRQTIIFVGGKGGVGKTTSASALALGMADRGKRCLLVSTDPAHSLGDLFDTQIGDRERALAPDLWGLEIDPEVQTDRYLESVKRSMRDLVQPEMYREIDRQMALTRLSPGAAEAAMLDRVTELMLDSPARYDLVVFDTAPTGHTLRLLSLPEIMAAWTDGMLRHRDRSDTLTRSLEQLRRKGRKERAGDELSYIDPVRAEEKDDRWSRIREVLVERRRKLHQARRLLLDAETTGFILVLIPEKLPILESRKALDLLRRYEVPVLGLLVNRVLPSKPLGEFMERRREQESCYLQEIEQSFAQLPRTEVPLLPRDPEGVGGLRQIANYLLPPE